jgi:hypothetical protein
MGCGFWAVDYGLRCNINTGLSVDTVLGCGLWSVGYVLRCNMERLLSVVQCWAVSCTIANDDSNSFLDAIHPLRYPQVI